MLCLAVVLIASSAAANEIWPKADIRAAPDAALEARVHSIVAGMTLEQKIGQMTQADIRSITPDDVRHYYIGSILNGGGAWPAMNMHSSVDDWLKLLTEANQIAERSRETWCNAMLELERGELLLLDVSEEAGGEADAAFKHAIDIAVDHGAKTLELRASVARARHYAQQGKDQKALDMLSPIYSWFSQGFETPDLLQAKMLLGELR